MDKSEDLDKDSNTRFFRADAKERSSLGNARCDFSGENNEGKVHGNVSLRVACQSCKLHLHDNTSSTINTSNSMISMRDCLESTVLGNMNSIIALNNTKLIVTEQSERNTLVVNGNTSFHLSGSNSCQISQNNEFVEVVGDKNELLLEKNERVRISGCENKVNVYGSTNLHITGNRNEVAIHQVKNATVIGDWANVLMTDVDTAHHTLEHLPLIAPGGINVNVVVIGATTYTSFALQPWNPLAHFQSHVSISKDRILVDGKLVNPENYEGLGMEKIEKIEHYNVKILFADRVSIVRNEYEAGIFHFLLFQSDCDVRSLLIEIVIDDLDAGSYRVEMDGSESVVIFGTKGGIPQYLKIIGKEVKAVVAVEAVSMNKPITTFIISVV